MKKCYLLLLTLFLALPFSHVGAQHTFSIVAVDSVTGEIGSAGASCIDGADTISDIIDTLEGTGAIHTQAAYDATNQQNARDRMEAGDSPQEVVTYVINNDAGGFIRDSSDRQYGVVDLDSTGSPRTAAYTGSNNQSYANHITGPNYSIQGNILDGQYILDSIEKRFRNAKGDLACKLMAALQGANVVGADTRCESDGTSSQSAFLRVSQPGDPDNRPSLDLYTNPPTGQEPIDSLQKLFDAEKDCQVASDTSKIRLTYVCPADNDYSIRNFDNVTHDISKLELCSKFDYVNNLSSLTVMSGSLNLAPGDSVTLTGFAVDDSADLGLYADGATFSDPQDMVDFTQWGSSGNGRESVAVSKGIWGQGDFIPYNDCYQYIGDGSDHGVNYWKGICFPKRDSITRTACDSFTVPSGDETYKTSGTYEDTLSRAHVSCDSLITIELTVNKSTWDTIDTTACGSYTVPSGDSTYTQSGTYRDTIDNDADCDSLLTIELTIDSVLRDSTTEVACDSFTVPSEDTTYTSSGVYNDTLQSDQGCDSIVTFDLTINESNDSTLTEKACDHYVFNGDTLRSSGTYIDTLTNKENCDSVVTLELTVVKIDAGVMKPDVEMLVAEQDSASYQWLNCDNGFAPVPGDTNQEFTPPIDKNGREWAVEIRKDGCVDTSGYYLILWEGVQEQGLSGTLRVHPNPADERLILEWTSIGGNSLSVKLFDLQGRLVKERALEEDAGIAGRHTLALDELPAGVYQLWVRSRQGVLNRKVVVK